jgi:hypothetical protein
LAKAKARSRTKSQVDLRYGLANIRTTVLIFAVMAVISSRGVSFAMIDRRQDAPR